LDVVVGGFGYYFLDLLDFLSIFERVYDKLKVPSDKSWGYFKNS
jgi:hypothetical protein